ncbi:MAG: hypothetical protein AB1744_06330 [Candidatus Zixiibacteriota bacterium]
MLSTTSATALAQTAADTVESLPGIEITTSVDRADMYVGDIITYTLAITYDSTLELIPPPLGANLGAFDVKDYDSDKRSILPDGRLKSVSSFKLSTFTTGDYIIPPIPVAFTLPDSSQKVVLSEAVPISVKSLLGEGADTADIRPLKTQYEFKRDLTRYYLWGGIGLFILLLFVIIVWLYLWKKRRAVKPVDLRPAWEIAFERLALLKQQPLLSKGRFKEYYIELTEIVREYLGRMYDLNVLDMTTEEFLERFLEFELPQGLHDNVGRFLRHADLVKFARFVPESERAEADFTFVHAMVEQVRADHERRRAAMLVPAGAGQGGAQLYSSSRESDQ